MSKNKNIANIYSIVTHCAPTIHDLACSLSTYHYISFQQDIYRRIDTIIEKSVLFSSEEIVCNSNASFIFQEIKTIMEIARHKDKISIDIVVERISKGYIENSINNKLILTFLSASNSPSVKGKAIQRKKLYNTLKEEKIKDLGIDNYKKSIYHKLR